MLHPRMTIETLGYIPGFLSEDNPRCAREQIDAAYAHGGGWSPHKGFTLDAANRLHGKGDPPLKPLAMAKLRGETIFFYRYSWVAIIQPDRSYEVARID
jgi:hypothetical protein